MARHIHLKLNRSEAHALITACASILMPNCGGASVPSAGRTVNVELVEEA